MSILSQYKQSQNTDFPNIRPSLDLRFALAKKLDPRITFTRGSIGTFVNKNGLIETAAANIPRFDYDPVTGQSLGLLVEESRQNYNLNSGDPTQWASTANMTLTGNSIVLPDGTTSTNVEYRGTNSGANSKLVRPTVGSGASGVSGDTWTFSIFLRAGTEQTVHLSFQTGTGTDNVGSTFNLVTGQFPGSISGGNAANGSRGVQYYGNGWYRVWLVNTYQSTFSSQQTFVRLRANSNAVQFTTSFSAWGAQLEKGAFPTSYIPTSGSTVTRSADNASMTGTNFSSWYNQSEGTIFVDTSNPAVSTIMCSISDGTLNNRIQLETGTNSRAIRNVFSGINQTSSISYVYNSKKKFVVSYRSNILNYSNDGILGSFIKVPGISTFNILRIGATPSPSGYLNSSIARLTYYPIQITNQQLINLSS